MPTVFRLKPEATQVKIWLIARREFVATTASWPFRIGRRFVPVMAVVALLVYSFVGSGPDDAAGDVAIVDATGLVAAEWRAALGPERAAARRQRRTAEIVAVVVPWMLLISQTGNPESPLVVALSFVPPINTFAMPVRLASATPPPAGRSGSRSVSESRRSMPRYGPQRRSAASAC